MRRSDDGELVRRTVLGLLTNTGSFRPQHRSRGPPDLGRTRRLLLLLLLLLLLFALLLLLLALLLLRSFAVITNHAAATMTMIRN